MSGPSAVPRSSTAQELPVRHHHLPLEEGAREATRMLGLLGDRRRLLLLCPLADGSLGAEDLAFALGVPEAAIPCLFAPLREDGLVVAEREGLRQVYRLAVPEAARVLRLLRDLYCTPDS